jgi:hypothetical protein
VPQTHEKVNESDTLPEEETGMESKTNANHSLPAVTISREASSESKVKHCSKHQQGSPKQLLVRTRA